MRKQRTVLNMKACARQKELAVLLTPIIICLILLAFKQLDLVSAIIIIFVGDGLLKTFFTLRAERIKKRQTFLKKLNDGVFKKWKKVLLESGNFHISIKDKGGIDPDLLRQGEEFLNSKNEQTKRIMKIWNKLELLNDKHNTIGDRIKKTIKKHLSDNYPNLKSAKSGFVDYHRLDNCYVTSNIVSFVEDSLKPVFLDNGTVNWENILQVQRYDDTVKPMFRLACDGDLIQSGNENDVNKMRFGTVMENMKQNILADLKQIDEEHRKIESTFRVFKEEMNHLSNLIDLSSFSS